MPGRGFDWVKRLDCAAALALNSSTERGSWDQERMRRVPCMGSVIRKEASAGRGTEACLPGARDFVVAL